MSAATIVLTHLDSLWFQVSGTLCNLACTHCFNRSGPGVRTFGMLDEATVRRAMAHAERVGVREVFFTGGEPFLHPHLLDFVALTLAAAPTTILTNGTLLSEAIADRLAALDTAARYSLEIRLSLDGYTEEMNDAIRGRRVFRRTLDAAARLSRRGMLPLITIVRTWPDEQELESIERFVAVLQAAGCARPRLKILPTLPLGRELGRQTERSDRGMSREADARTSPSPPPETDHVSEEMLEGFDRGLLMCSSSRIVTDRGIWVCPLLVENAAARVGDELEDAATRHRLRSPTCVECWRYGTICSNLRPDLETPRVATP